MDFETKLQIFFGVAFPVAGGMEMAGSPPLLSLFTAATAGGTALYAISKHENKDSERDLTNG